MQRAHAEAERLSKREYETERQRVLGPLVHAWENLRRRLESERAGIDRFEPALRPAIIELLDRAFDLVNEERRRFEQYDLDTLRRREVVDVAGASIVDEKHSQSAQAVLSALVGTPSAVRLVRLLLEIVVIEGIDFYFGPAADLAARTGFPVGLIVRLAASDRDAVVQELLLYTNTPEKAQAHEEAWEHKLWGRESWTAVAGRRTHLAEAAVTALGEVGDAGASTVLRSVIRNHTGDWPRLIPYVVCAIAAVGDPDGIPDVLDAIQDAVDDDINHPWWAACDYVSGRLSQLVTHDDRVYSIVAARWSTERGSEEYDDPVSDNRVDRKNRRAPLLVQVLEIALLRSRRINAVDIAVRYARSADSRKALLGTEILTTFESDEATQSLMAILRTRRRYVIKYRFVDDLGANLPSEYDWNDDQRLIAAKTVLRRQSSDATEAVRLASRDAAPQYRLAFESLISRSDIGYQA